MAPTRERWYAEQIILNAPLGGALAGLEGRMRETSIRILLVEDDVDVAPMLEHVLLLAGFGVHMAGTVAEARELLDSRSYALVLADVMLPDGSGIGVADAAKARGIEAVVITGHAFRIPAEELARHEVLLKPLRPRQVVETVTRSLGHSK